MSQLAFVVPIIRAHQDQLKRLGVLSARPGYKLENNWPTREPAIVVTVSRDASVPLDLPFTIEGIPVEVRRATAVEELRFKDPAAYRTIAQHHGGFRGGAFPEFDLTPGASPSTPDKSSAAHDDGLASPSAATKPQIPYTPAKISLKPVTGALHLTCHASPDAGWPVLNKFLAATQSKLTVGLYDFTSKHILDAVSGDLASKRSFQLVLDYPPRDASADQTDPQTVAALQTALGAEFKQVWALVRGNTEVKAYIFPSAYHIKVAVRDSKSVWLSSGNWNNSNQPDMDPIGNPQPTDQQTAQKSDRDWHVIIDSPTVAKQFEAYITHDFTVAVPEEQSQAFAPMKEELKVPEEFLPAATGTFLFHPPLEIAHERVTVTPLLTPDAASYQPAMLQLISSAQSKLYVQLQYIHPPADGVDTAFRALIDAVAQKIKDGKDVRIICSQYQVSNGWLERLQEAGIDLSKVKIQNGVHNKGFVIDSAYVAVGSQNWSGDGVLRNRDATVIIKSSSAANYFEQIFLHDWDRLATQHAVS